MNCWSALLVDSSYIACLKGQCLAQSLAIVRPNLAVEDDGGGGAGVLEQGHDQVEAFRGWGSILVQRNADGLDLGDLEPNSWILDQGDAAVSDRRINPIKLAQDLA